VPLGDARKRSGIAAFFCCGRVDIIRSQTQDSPHLVSKSSGRVPPSVRPPNAGAGPSQRPWHNHGVVPSPHCRLSLPRKDRQLAWQNPKRAPSRHCRLSLPRKDFPRAWHNRTLVVTSQGMPRTTAPGARARRTGNTESNRLMRASKSAIAVSAIKLRDFSPAHGSQPGAQAGRHALKGQKDLGSVCMSHRHAP
jgi:hypothetical protein